jgi:hypothetical protein
LVLQVTPLVEVIPINPDFGNGKTLRLTGSAVVIIVVLKTQPNEVLESMVTSPDYS